MGKKYRMIPLLGILCFSLSGCSAASVWSSVLVILSIFLLALAIWGTWCYIEYLQKLRRRPNRYKKRPLSPVTLVLYGISLLLFVIAGLVSCQKQPAASPVETTPVTTEPTEPPVLFHKFLEFCLHHFFSCNPVPGSVILFLSSAGTSGFPENFR